MYLQAATHMVLQLLVQQDERYWQTHFSHWQPLQPGLEWATHMLAQQSWGQLLQVSEYCLSHVPLPQQLPQSWGQVLQSSWPLHLPSPQEVQVPQSLGQLPQFSPAQVSHVLLPHWDGQAPQSAGQVMQVSKGFWHLPLPQEHSPQSAGQLWHDS